MEKTWLQDFLGQRISAVTGHHEDKSEAGTLLAMGDGWLQLEKDNGELLLIPFTAIRILKLLDMTRTTPAIAATQTVYTPLAPVPLDAQNDSPSGY